MKAQFILPTIIFLTAFGCKAIADGTKTRGFLWSRKRKNRARRTREAWNAGADYIKRGWEIAWNELTGARFLERYTTTETSTSMWW